MKEFMLKRIILAVALVLLPLHSYAGQTYHCKSVDGKKSFQDKPCKDITLKVQERDVSSSVVSKTDIAAPTCLETNNKNLELILKDINDHYEKRSIGCKEDYNPGTSHRKNCLQEQEEIREEKMNRYYYPKKKAVNYC